MLNLFIFNVEKILLNNTNFDSFLIIMMYEYIDKYNITLGRYFFNNLNLFTYNLFNFCLKVCLKNQNILKVC